ncbi:glycoside hydrolase family 9 protein [Cytophaga sp.]|uniref:glycoside hydrolase family 9 protein n=1 Tax=Cytophaga sp. TaxID=29535 RepID=UPI003F7EBAD1
MQAQSPVINYNIRLNQIGFYSNLEKIAIVAGNPAAGNFSIQSPDLATTYFTGTLGASATWSFSNETVRAADFSAFTTPGTYVLYVPGVGYSPPFIIDPDAFNILSKTVLKGFYYKRASSAITATYGGVYARAMGHPDTNVMIHSSAASPGRPAGTIVSAPKGWYDAGDYGCYTVNSGISTYTLLASFEHFKSYYDTLPLNIPESGNAMPDILDEIKWNLDWMLTMQDPYDGGVYHKKTTAAFDAFEMPAADQAQRYLIGKATAATFDFAAVMAVAYRVYLPYDAAYANQCLAAAKTAYTWGIANPSITFSNPAGISTGGYGDGTLTDEKEWAATELYISTKDNSYYTNSFKSTNTYGIPSWPNVNTLGLISLIHHRKSLTANGLADTTAMKNKLFALANPIRTHKTSSSAYKTGMGANGNADFIWGSNAVALNEGMICMAAYLATNDLTYLNTAISQLDYILGRNATAYSFVSGLGSKQIMNPHDRISSSDGVAKPIPGWMAGGPNTDSRGDCGAASYPSSYKAASYLDQQCSYSTNEIAINWNAPLVFVGIGMQYIHRTALNPFVKVLNGTADVPNNGTAISMGSAVVGSTSNVLTITVKNSGTVPLIINSITGDEIFVTGLLNPASPIAPGTSSTFSITATPANAGLYTGKITISTNDQTNASYIINLSVTGTAPAINISQGSTTYANNGAAYDFSATLQGTQSNPVVFTIKNTGTAPLTLGTPAVTGPFLISSGPSVSSVPAGGSATFSVKFIPVATGAATGTINFPDNAADSPFILNLSGTGVQPAISVSQANTVYTSNGTPYIFPATLQNHQSAIYVFTITNSGTAVLTLGTPVVTGPFQLTGPSVVSVPAGSTTTFNIVFAPVTTGNITGSVSIPNNAPDSPFVLNLAGTSVVPVITVTQGSTTFSSNGAAYVFSGTTAGSSSAAVEFTITNPGSATLDLSGPVATGPFQITGPSLTSVPAGGSTTFSVIFSPVVTGGATGNINIVNNTDDSPFVLNLSGTGTLATGTAGILAAEAISISPNPTKQNISIQMKGAYNNVSVHIYNTVGELVLSTILGNTNDASFPLLLTNVAPGMYLVEVTTDEGSCMKRIVKE